jgi:hypothetical protein
MFLENMTANSRSAGKGTPSFYETECSLNTVPKKPPPSPPQRNLGCYT